MQKRAKIRQQDILSVDVSPASPVTLYLLPDVNLKLKPRLLSRRGAGARVAHSFDMDDWKPGEAGTGARSICGSARCQAASSRAQPSWKPALKNECPNC